MTNGEDTQPDRGLNGDNWITVANSLQIQNPTVQTLRTHANPTQRWPRRKCSLPTSAAGHLQVQWTLILTKQNRWFDLHKRGASREGWGSKQARTLPGFTHVNLTSGMHFRGRSASPNLSEIQSLLCPGQRNPLYNFQNLFLPGQGMCPGHSALRRKT